LLATLTSAATVEDDVQQYIAIFKGDVNEHVASADTLHWMGLSDERLYDVIEQRLQQDLWTLQGGFTAKTGSDSRRLGWYLRALGFSGQAKYLPTLERFTSNGILGRYAKEALKESPLFAKWNPVISDRSTFDAQRSDADNRMANMLRSPDIQLKGLGARRMAETQRQLGDEALLESLAFTIRANYTSDDWTTANSVAWMVKALASTRMDKYQSLIEEVWAKATRSELRRHAHAALLLYYR
jgi:hypothetical protein